MDVWIWGFGLVIVGLAVAGLLRAFGLSQRRREIWDKDESRLREQRRWIETGEIERMSRYETDYSADEMIDEDVARMEQMGFYVAYQAPSVDGSRLKVVYRREGVLAVL